jgi:adenine-specific DNA-methyltransferase
LGRAASSRNPTQRCWFGKRNYSTLDFEFARIYVNGDNNLENLKIGEECWKIALIEQEFKKLMFDVEGV